MQLDQPWWLAQFNDANTFNGSLYAAAGSSQLMVVDSLWCLFFNEDRMTDLKLELPYDLVREGKWTIDKLSEYARAAANLNGDDSFAWNTDGKAVYGIAYSGTDKFFIGMNERFLDTVDGELTLTAGTERFYRAVSTFASRLSSRDGTLYAHPGSGVSDDDPGSYIYAFEHERSLFVTAELSKATRMRSIEAFTFGIVPYPKLDELQENYYSMPFYGTPCFAIPTLTADPDFSAAVGDALSYLSYEMVMPVFREVTLEQKGLRNDDSIEMLDIIISSSVPDLSRYSPQTRNLMSAVAKKALAGDDSVASDVASFKEAILAELDAINNPE